MGWGGVRFDGFLEGEGKMRDETGIPGRKPGCFPNRAWSWSMRPREVARICSSDGRGIVTVMSLLRYLVLRVYIGDR